MEYRPLVISFIIVPISDQTIVSHRSGNHNLIIIITLPGRNSH